MHISKAKQGINLLLAISRCSVISKRAGLHYMNGLLGKAIITPNFPPFLFPQLYVLSMVPYGLEYPCAQLGSAVLAVHPVQSGTRSRKVLGTVRELLSSNRSVPLLSTQFSTQIQNSVPSS